MSVSLRGRIRLAATMLVCAVRIGVAQMTSGGSATTPLPRAERWWVARHLEKVAEARRGGVDLLFVGDSITENYERAGPAPDEVFRPIWKKLFAPHHAMNLGFSGDGTQHVLWRLKNGEIDGLRPRDIVLLIGTNNTGRGESAGDVAEGVIAVVEELHARMPGARILLLGILPSDGGAVKVAADREVNRRVTERYAGSAYVRTLDLGAIFHAQGELDTSLFYDPAHRPPHHALHPNTEGQKRMAEAVAAALFSGHDSPRGSR